MDRYDVRVVWYDEDLNEIDLSGAISGPVSITNGRTDLTTSIGQNYASLTFLKSALFGDLQAQSYSTDSFSFGSLVNIRVMSEGPPSLAYSLFWGNVTDMRSDDYEIQFSLIANYVYKVTGLFPYEYAGGTGLTNYIAQDILGNTGGGPLLDDTTSASRTSVVLEPATITNALTYLSSIIGQAPSQYLFCDPNRDGWVLSERPQGFPDVVITEAEVLRDYSIDRSIDDVTNSVSVVYESGTFTRTNETSVQRIGKRFNELQTQLNDASDAEQLGTWFLGAHAPAGFPLISFRTSVELLGIPVEDIATNIQPNRVLDLTAVTVEGFGDYAYIEQLRHTITRSTWTLDLVASNAAYSELTQTWIQVTPSLDWADVPNDPPTVVTWDDLLYIDL